MLRLEDGNPAPLESTRLADEGFRERDLQEWIIEQPAEFLKDEFLLIGREVTVKGLGDAIDLLAIDPDGNLVIIELKRGALKDPVDFQGLKYAAYTAQWDYDHLKNQFETFRSAAGSHLFDPDTSFQDELDEFCNEEYTINQDQRIVLVGEEIRERLHLIIHWLADRDVDVTVIALELLTDGEEYYLDTEQRIPVSETSPPEYDPDTSDKPWEADGRSWHLEEITNEATGELLEDLVSAINKLERLDGPRWGQKLYVSFRIGRKNRVLLRTQTEQIHLQIYDIDPSEVEPSALAERLNVSPEQIVAEGKIPGARRQGVQITCRGDESVDVDAVTREINQLLGDGST